MGRRDPTVWRARWSRRIFSAGEDRVKRLLGPSAIRLRGLAPICGKSSLPIDDGLIETLGHEGVGDPVETLGGADHEKTLNIE